LERAQARHAHILLEVAPYEPRVVGAEVFPDLKPNLDLQIAGTR